MPSVEHCPKQVETVVLSVNGAKILLLGVTYKPDIADERESPAQPLARRLLNLGAKLSYHDPLVKTWDIDGVSVPCVEDHLAAAETADLTVLLQNHTSYDLEALANATETWLRRRPLRRRGAHPPPPRIAAPRIHAPYASRPRPTGAAAPRDDRRAAAPAPARAGGTTGAACTSRRRAAGPC